VKNANNPSVRRTAMGHFQPKTIFSGVHASDAMRKTSPRRPSWFKTSEMGFAPRLPVTARTASSTKGTSDP